MVAVGNGAKTEDGKIVKMDVKAGDRGFCSGSGLEQKLKSMEKNIA